MQNDNPTGFKSTLRPSMSRHLSSFSYLNITQSIGAFNDNLYKLLVIFYLIQVQGDENSSRIIALAGAIYILPFLLFARVGGILADKFSKSNIILATRIFGFLIAIGSLLMFYFGSTFGTYCMLFAMAINSTIFVITRNSMLPEIVPSDNISNANGVMSSVGFVAIILGTFSASFLLDITGRNYVYSSLLLILTAAVAVAASWLIEYTPPARDGGSHEKIQPFFLAEIYSSLKQASKYPDLLSSILGAAFFLFFGAYFQLNLIPFVMESLHLSDLQGGYMFLVCALGIGLGSVIAGKISKKTVELGLVPVSSALMALCLLFMYLYANQLYPIIFLSAIIGLFGGLFDIPLESYVQYKSPANIRGHIVAATKFMSSFGVLCASGLIYFLSNIVGLNASEGFLVLGFIVALVTGFYAYLYRSHVKRFFDSK